MTACIAEREGLLRDVAQNPDDMTPRLIFADWCDDNGDPERAEFIRAQVELGRLDREEFDHVTRTWRSTSADIRAWQLIRRTVDLERRRFAEWALSLGGLSFEWWSYDDPDPPHAGVAMARHRGGFVGDVFCLTTQWEEHGRAICAAHPVRRVECLAAVRGATVFRGGGHGDITPRLWHDLGLIYSACLGTCPDGVLSRLRGTHTHFDSDEAAKDFLSDALIRWARGPQSE